MANYQLQNRGELRRSIGKNLGIVTDGAATAADAGKTLLTDTKNLLGGNDEHNQKEVMIYDATGSIVDGETSIVSDFASNVATCVPIFSAAIAIGDKYEMWKTPWRIADINDAINQAIMDVTPFALASRVTTDNFTQASTYEYDWLTPYAFGSDFRIVEKVEYVSSIGIDHLLSDCETAWTAGTSVTATADSAFTKKGTYSAKFEVAAGAASGATLGYIDISEVNISDSKEVVLWFYSSIAITAGQLQFMAGATAAIASPLETINIPAMSAGTWYRHVLTLANPHLDTAIISIGVRQASGVDVGAFTFYLDDVRATDAFTNQYQELSDEYWSIVHGASPLLRLNSSGLSRTGPNKQIRITGFSSPDLFTDDATDGGVDPGWLIPKVTERLLISHAKSSSLSIPDRATLAAYWRGEAARKESGLTPSFTGIARMV